LSLVQGTVLTDGNNGISYAQGGYWQQTERFTYAIFVGGTKHRAVEDYVTSGFRYWINGPSVVQPEGGDFADKDLSRQGIQADGGLALSGGGILINPDPSDETDPKVQADGEVFEWIAAHAKCGDFLLLTGDTTSTDSVAGEWLDSVPVLAGNGGHPFDSVEALQYIYAVVEDVSNPAAEATNPVNVLAREMANDWFAIRKLGGAEAIFFDGGDQWRYIATWGGTAVAQTVSAKYAAGHTVVGGTSAGLAILGDWVNAGQFGTTGSADALLHPRQYDPGDPTTNCRITLQKSFLEIGPLAGVITDTHFGDLSLTQGDEWEDYGNRSRMGRLIAFVANIKASQDGYGGKGLGVDAGTAVLVEPDGTARVAGMFNAYFVTATEEAAYDGNGRLVAPLTIHGVKVRRVSAASGLFQLSDAWDHCNSTFGLQYTIDVTAGVLQSDNGSVY
jgi:cyanophycinase-like exopeptidase